jgi:hypothetical protein
LLLVTAVGGDWHHSIARRARRLPENGAESVR